MHEFTQIYTLACTAALDCLEPENYFNRAYNALLPLFWPHIMVHAQWLLHGFIAACAATAFADPLQQRMERLHIMAKREMTSNGGDFNKKKFDYIIVGGGQAGLTVAGRLSEDPSVTVAVIEAGPSGMSKTNAPKIDVPAGNLYNSPGDTEMNWHFSTVKQDNLEGKEKPWPRGRVLGGSSAVNGLYYVRPSKLEIDNWGKLIGDSKTWTWDSMFKAMKKSESFSKPTDKAQKVGDIKYNADSHGTNGPVNVSWPAVSYPVVSAFVQSSNQVATHENNDPYAGNNTGSYVGCLTLNPSNWTRSFSRSGYIDPYIGRPNLHVLTGFLVTQVMFDTSDSKNVKATGVKYQQSRDGDSYTVMATREVILSAGAVQTPQVLQLSGIGDAKFLKSKKVPVVVDLPGVGHNLQDHLSIGVQWNAKDPHTIAPAKLTGDKKVDSYTNSATAFASSEQIMGSGLQDYLNQVTKNRTAAVKALPAPDPVKAGYDAIYQAKVDMLNSSVGQMELLLSLTFGSIQVQAALQHAMSHGTIMINTTDPFDYPIIDPRYMEQKSDMTAMLAGVKLAQKIGSNAPMTNYTGDRVNPPANVKSDDQWVDWLRKGLGTEYHPCGTASLLPKKKGGVVDKNLIVYGTSNLRVIDASIVPIVPAAHLVAIVYGLAEIGADLVKSANKGSNSQQGKDNQKSGGSATGGDSKQGSQGGSNSQNDSKDNAKGSSNGSEGSSKGNSNGSKDNAKGSSDASKDNAKGNSDASDSGANTSSASQKQNKGSDNAAPSVRVPLVAVTLALIVSSALLFAQ